MEGDTNHYAESWIWSVAPVNPGSAAGLGFCTDSSSKSCSLQALCSSWKRWHVLKVWGTAKVTEMGMQKSRSCHYRLMGNTIFCCVKVSCSFGGAVRKWSLGYKLLFFAVNQSLKLHSGSWFCSKLFGYILWIFMESIPMKSIELYQFCTAVNLNSVTEDSGDVSPMYINIWWEGVQKMESDSSQWYQWQEKRQ